MFLSRETVSKLYQIVYETNSSAVYLSRDTRDNDTALLLVEALVTVQTVLNDIINYTY